MNAKKNVLSLAVLLAVLFSACQPNATPTQPSLTTFLPQKSLKSKECRFTVQEEDEVSCHTLEVPADYNHIEGEQLELEIVWIKSTSDNPSPDPVLILPFDPNFDFLQYTGFFIDNLRPLLEDRDVVLYNNRGVNLADEEFDLTCREVENVFIESIMLPERGDAYEKRTLDAYEACRRRISELEADLNHYSTSQSASDVVAVSLAFGKRQVHLYGLGYGSIVGFKVLQNHPEVVRSAMFNSIYPPHAIVDYENGYYLALQELFEACRVDLECDKAYPDLEEGFLFIIEMLNANPLVLDVQNPITPGMIKVYLTGGDFILLFRDMLSDSGSLSKLPKVIHDVRNGQGYKLAADLQNVLVGRAFGTLGASIFNGCIEDWTAVSASPNAVDGVYEPVREALHAELDLYARVCATWNQRDFIPSEVTPVYSSAPLLVFHGALDPYTSPELAEAWLQNMKNANLVVSTNTSGAFFFNNNCGFLMAKEYFGAPGKTPDTSCAVSSTIDFILPMR